MLQAEELKRDITIDPTSKYAIDVTGDFQFPSLEPPDLTVSKEASGFGSGNMSDKIKARDKKKKEAKEAKERKKKGLPPLESEKAKEREPFALRDIDLLIPRGESCPVDSCSADDEKVHSSVLSVVSLRERPRF